MTPPALRGKDAVNAGMSLASVGGLRHALQTNLLTAVLPGELSGR